MIEDKTEPTEPAEGLGPDELDMENLPPDPVYDEVGDEPDLDEEDLRILGE